MHIHYIDFLTLNNHEQGIWMLRINTLGCSGHLPTIFRHVVIFRGGIAEVWDGMDHEAKLIGPVVVVVVVAAALLCVCVWRWVCHMIGFNVDDVVSATSSTQI